MIWSQRTADGASYNSHGDWMRDNAEKHEGGQAAAEVKGHGFKNEFLSPKAASEEWESKV